jgi:predicted nucleic acid-binding protein
LGIKIIGTIGIILKAAERGFINNLAEIIEKLEQTDFRLSPKLKQQLIDADKIN